MQYPDLHLPKNVNQWRTGNFYLREAAADGEGIPAYSPGGSRPCNLQEQPQEADLEMVELLQVRLHELMEAALLGLNLVATFMQRRIAPLLDRTTLMHEDTGIHDPSRLSQLTWKSKDFIAQIGRLTGYALEDEAIPGFTAYSAKHPAPMVSCFPMENSDMT